MWIQISQGSILCVELMYVCKVPHETLHIPRYKIFISQTWGCGFDAHLERIIIFLSQDHLIIIWFMMILPTADKHLINKFYIYRYSWVTTWTPKLPNRFSRIFEMCVLLGHIGVINITVRSIGAEYGWKKHWKYQLVLIYFLCDKLKTGKEHFYKK